MINYFELMSIPISFDIDPKQLETAYFDAQRRYHPDRLASKSGTERHEAAALSAGINEAYSTLKDPLLRARHLLASQGVNATEGADAATLAEMMELQETISEGKNPDIAALIAECKQSLQGAFAAGDWTRAKHSTIRLGYLYKLPHHQP
jgi:molecular chaperone HscB